MCWKKMSYWLRGGLIGLVVALIYDMRGLVFDEVQSLEIWFFALIIDLIITFIIGAIFGLIIGGILERRRKRSSPRKNSKIARKRKKKK